MNCEHCQIGKYHLVTKPYLCKFDERLMVIPNAPAYTCDVCRQTHYDPGFILNIRYLLDRVDEHRPERISLQAVREERAKWSVRTGVDNRVR